MKLITHKDKVYREFTQGALTGFVELPIPKAEPTIRYTGSKIPIALWQQVTSWFNKHKGNEVQVRLYTDFTSWRAVPFPQSYPSGMTISEIPNHPDSVALNASLNGWTHYGSIHHHCAASAFQSNTDERDEKGVAGLHLTVGHMDKATYDLHARVCVKVFGVLSEAGEVLSPATQGFYTPTLADWFELPPEAASLPVGLHESVIKFYLTQAVAVAFPPEWDAALIEVAKPTYPNWAPAAGHAKHNNALFNNDYVYQRRMEPVADKIDYGSYAQEVHGEVGYQAPLLDDKSTEDIFTAFADLATDVGHTTSSLFRAWLFTQEDAVVARVDELLYLYDINSSEFIDIMRGEGVLTETELNLGAS